MTHVKHWLSCPHHRPDDPDQKETDLNFEQFELWLYRQYYQIGVLILGLGIGVEAVLGCFSLE